jgi:hypothetical protein
MGKLTYEKIINYKKIRDIKHLITEKQEIEINKIANYYDTSTIKNRLDSIRQFILCGVDNRWLGRLRIIRNKLKTDVISEYSCKIRYGDNWKKKQDEIKDKVKMNKENFIKKYGKKIGTKKWEERNRKVVSYGLKPAIERYGEVEGRKKWEDTLSRKITTMSERKKIKPYRNGRTLVEYQERHGIKVGYEKWKLRNEKQKYRFSPQYYIDKYGDGFLEEWEKYTKSMSKTSFKSFTERYGEELGFIKFNEHVYKIIENLKVRPNYSRISQELFFKLLNNFENTENIYFAEHRGEYIFYPKITDSIFGLIKIIQVDFKFGNKIIEFDGNYWHSKPEQIEKDKLRDEYLIKKGYIIKRVKESDYKTNKEQITNECLIFLKNK